MSYIFKPRTYDVIVIDLENDCLRTLGQVTVTEDLYRAEQAKRETVGAQINFLPKHCALKIDEREHGRHDITVKMV